MSVDETVSVPAPTLGMHVRLRFRAGRLAQVRLVDAPDEGAPPASAEARAIGARVARHLATGREDLRDVAVDLDDLPPFHKRALIAIRDVPPGAVATYGDVARLVGEGVGAARAVGVAMASNPVPIVVPCHRVVPADGAIGNYSAPGGADTKRALLRLEGARLPAAWEPRQAKLPL